MDDELFEAIRAQVISTQRRSLPFGPANPRDIEDAEASLGFRLPEILRLLYLKVGNGGFGPGQRGTIIGVKGGYATSAGTLVEQYEDMRRGAEFFELEWRSGLLPFCEWGCTIFSCVDCNDEGLQMYLCEECRPEQMDYGLEGFLNMWVSGEDLLDRGVKKTRNVDIINPFDRKRASVRRREKQ